MQTINSANFIGERLTQARKARGITAISLAELIGVTSGAISKYENSKNSPKSETLSLLAEKLNFPQSYFFQPIDQSISSRCIKWRSLASVSKLSIERGEARYDWARKFTAYIESYFDLPKINIPTLDLPKDFRELQGKDIDEAANQCREYWGLGQSPINDLVLLLENNGVIVSRIQFDADKQDAFSEWDEYDHPYVFLGTDKNVGVRSRFDAAHELGHLILHRNVKKEEYRNSIFHKQIESQAHRFASAFLMPKNEFFKSLWAPTFEAYSALKPRWKVSIKAMIVYSHRHGVLNDNQYQRMLIQYSRNYKNGEPLDDVLTCEKPRLLARCVEALVDSKIKTKDEILNDLSLFAGDVADIVGLPKKYFMPKATDVVQLLPKLKNLQEFSTNNVMQFPKKGS